MDVLARPGLISHDEAKLAAERGVRLEVSARKGHSLANGHVVREAGVTFTLDSDAHAPEDLLTPELCEKVAKGAGLDDDEVHALLEENPGELLTKLGLGAVLPV